MVPSTIVWFRQDLRIEDHPALVAACQRGMVIPVYILDSDPKYIWNLGGASKWWLHYSLESLANELKSIGLSLIFRKGPVSKVLEELIKETEANALYWSRCYEPAAIELDAKIKKSLHDKGLDVQSFNSALLYEPWAVANKKGKPFQVFTPFWKTCLNHNRPDKPILSPTKKSKFSHQIQGVSLNDLHLLPKIHWDGGIKESWKPGAPYAKLELTAFLNQPILDYHDARNFPAREGVSRLSPYLHFGEISPRMIWHAALAAHPNFESKIECYLRQLGWREFAYHLLYHFPDTPTMPLRNDFSEFPWKKSSSYLHAWQKGLTGYPFIDAGMRQLWKTGWMHNRVRMVVGSFLVKDLLISWVDGAKWFWDTLVDADLANNTLGWQWIGGCGADSAPYFRIFNPITQGEKFDAYGDYIRQWVPELAQLPNQWIQKPWEATDVVLQQAGITLGKTYPFPIVDHAKARIEALNAFSSIRGSEE